MRTNDENLSSTVAIVRRPTTFTKQRLNRKYLMIGAFVAVMLVVTVNVALSVPTDTTKSVRSVEVAQERGKVEPTGVPSANDIYDSAAVTSDSLNCSNIASDVLKKNGSAVDAAIAALLCLGIYAPQSMGVGGGFFMTIYDRKSGTASVIDAREVAPFAATKNMYDGNASLSLKGPLAVAVPGQIRGLELAHKLYGTLPWKDLFEPTVALCRDGTLVASALASHLQGVKDDIFADPGLKDVFVDKTTNQLYKENDTLRMPQLAKTLEAIGAQGADVMYTGTIARQLVDEIQQMGGIITMEDFANYTALKKDPVTCQLSDGLRVFDVPPPASGTVFSEMLLILDGYNMTNSSRDSLQDSILTYHRIIEAFKFSFAKRTELADDQFVDMTQLVKNTTSPEYVKGIRELISDNRTFPSEYYGPVFSEDYGTSHLSIVAPNGDAVSVTSTINTWFGAKILSPSSGIILNNEMDDFSSPNITNFFDVPPSPNNLIEPRKRPVSSTAAVVAVDAQGNVQMVTGAAGGTIITTATAYTFILNRWLGDDIATATDALRLHHQLYPQTVTYEQGFPEDILEGLARMGHNVTLETRKSVVNAIARTSDGRLQACADGRKGGDVSGF